jgi:hypothetical protein
MGTKYTDQSASSYDSTPPADDGTVSEANKVKWSTIKTKLSDPVKTQADAISDALVTHFDNGPRALITNTTLGASDYGKIIQVSGSGVTLTLTDAASLTAGWYCRIINNDSSNGKTIARATGGDTINGSAANYTMDVSQGIDVVVNAAANGFLLRSVVINPVTTDTTQSVTAPKTFTTSTLAGSPLTVEGTNAGAQGPIFKIIHNSASPAVSDQSYFSGVANNSSAAQINYTQQRFTILDPVAGTEDGQWELWTIVAGAEGQRLNVAQGLQVGAPTGGDKGASTGNFAGLVYVNNVQLARVSGDTLTTTTLTSPVINSATGIGQTVWKYKTAAESVASSATLQDDDHLVVAMDANASYEIRIDAPFLGSGNLNACGIKSGVTIPSGASVVNAWMDLITDSHNSVVKQASGGSFDVTTADLSTGGLLANCKYRFYVTTSSTSGNFVFRWAQSTSNATTLQLPSGSSLEAVRTL